MSLGNRVGHVIGENDFEQFEEISSDTVYELAYRVPALIEFIQYARQLTLDLLEDNDTLRQAQKKMDGKYISK